MIIAKFNVFINRRDVNYLSAALTEDNYRKVLTSALNQCVDGHKTYKYSQVTDYIYKAVFKENAKEYRNVLSLDARSILPLQKFILLASYNIHATNIGTKLLRTTSLDMPGTCCLLGTLMSQCSIQNTI